MFVFSGTTERICLITGNVDAIMSILIFIMEKIREKPDLNAKQAIDFDNKTAAERDKQVNFQVIKGRSIYHHMKTFNKLVSVTLISLCPHSHVFFLCGAEIIIYFCRVRTMFTFLPIFHPNSQTI